MSVLELIASKSRSDYQRDNFDAFLKKVGFHYDVPSIHVTGTNGKGSVCNYLNNIYLSSGRKVGLFISPMNYSIADMIKVNNVDIPVSEIESIYSEYRKQIEKYDLSSFEITTFIALTYFQKENVDLAIIECGMGGAIDATNIFNPILSIITSISVEHTNFLGVSLSEIALHKAGIIKDKIPVLLGDVKGDALDVIVNKTKYCNSKIYTQNRYFNEVLQENGYSFGYLPYHDLKIKSRGLTSVTDACIAIEATSILKEQFPVEEVQIKEGLLCDPLIGRLEIHEGHPTIIIDGAHNPDAIVKLRNDVEGLHLNKPIHVVFASFKDKNITVMLPEIALLGDLHLTTFDHVRARNEEDYFLYLEDYKFTSDHIELIKELKTQFPEDVIVITGSLAFASLVHKELMDEKI